MNKERGIPLKEIVTTKDERGKIATKMMFYTDIAILYFLMNKYLEPSILPVPIKIINYVLAGIMLFVATGNALVLYAHWDSLKRVEHKRYQL